MRWLAWLLSRMGVTARMSLTMAVGAGVDIADRLGLALDDIAERRGRRLGGTTGR